MTASLGKRTVIAPFAFSCDLKLGQTGCAYLAKFPSRKRTQRLLVSRNAFAARPVKNDVSGSVAATRANIGVQPQTVVAAARREAIQEPTEKRRGRGSPSAFSGRGPLS
jgi:hypothetical protein